MKTYQICQICVMDTSDSQIIFMGEMGCNHCSGMKSLISIKSKFLDTSDSVLQGIINDVKISGINRNYDSILGLSGGLDSSYLALKCFDWGLKPLLLHVDTGWNSETAVKNIQSIVDFTGWKLHTHVIDWNEMRDLQLAYFKSGISNQDVPQDHAIFSALYKFASKNGIKYVLNGGNTATEGIFPKSWHGSAMDSKNLRDIHDKHGAQKLVKYPTTSFSKYYIYYPFIKKIKAIRPLNFIDYDKKSAAIELAKRTGWKSYPRKHGESIFTRFFQEYFLIERFGLDKRRPHLSSQIVSGQISRSKALDVLLESVYDPAELKKDTLYVCRKLRIGSDEFQYFMSTPIRNSSDYKNWTLKYKILKNFQTIIAKFFKIDIKIYS